MGLSLFGIRANMYLHSALLQSSTGAKSDLNSAFEVKPLRPSPTSRREMTKPDEKFSNYKSSHRKSILRRTEPF